MGTKSEKKDWGTTRQAEERHLEKTLAVINENIRTYGHEVLRMKEDIDEMLEHYHDNDVEVFTILNNTITLHEHMERALMRNEKAQNKPYFGRIIFHDEALDKEESLYIGRGGIAKDATHQMVVDWRAPVANAYYENGMGKCSYEAPGGVQMEIDLKLKRTYEVEGGKLLDYFDSEVIANDDLLTKYLAKNKQAVLGEIVATIQKEQNEIIRKSPYHNIIVQGVAGSGKTTVAMHRISYILYNYKERFRPEDFYIVGSNRILLNYITGVLPDLDVYGVRQMTMEQLFVRLLYEDWEEDKYCIKGVDKKGKEESIKGSVQWFRDLEEYCQRLESETISRESVFLNRKQFVEGVKDGKTGVFDETKGKKADPGSLVCLLEGKAVEDYIRENPSVSIQNKIDMLNERLTIKIKDEFLGKTLQYTEAERKAILKAYRGRYGGRVWKRSIYDLYHDFLTRQVGKGYGVDIPEKALDVYDLAALAYLYKRVKEKEVISEAHHVVIDEAQDFGMMAYCALKFCITGCTYTIMGDVSQNIHFGYGLNDWEELKELLLTDSACSFGILKKSYRNTVEISDFATKILHHGKFSIYPVEPIIRHGNPVRVQQITDRKRLIWETADTCRSWQAKGLDTIAVICRHQESAARAAAELKEYVEIMESDLEKAEFGNGILVLPVEYTKGLEFDAVLILDPTGEEYPTDDGHARLLYVAATRALHELCVLHLGNLTGLISQGNEPDDRVSPDILQISGEPAASPLAAELPIARSLSGENAPEKENRPVAASIGGGTPARKKPVAIIAKPATPEDKKPFISRKTAKSPAGLPERQNATPDAVSKIPVPVKTEHTVRAAGNEFGDMPATENLRPAGHGKIDLEVRWTGKEPDGLYLHSRYGILRLSPVRSDIVRVTFTKEGKMMDAAHPGIALSKTEQTWMYRENGKAVEFLTDNLCLRADKATGAVCYMTRDKKILLSERNGECRQQQKGSDGKIRNWLYLDWQKGETLYGIGWEDKPGIKLSGTARYISHGENTDHFPFLLSDKGYGILLATDAPAICCDITSYGAYLSTESGASMDYYFIQGETQNAILSAGAFLCGKATCAPQPWQ